MTLTRRVQVALARRAQQFAKSILPTTLGIGGWFPFIREPYTGAWQKNDEASAESLLAHSAVFSCTSLIASDIAKMHLRLMQVDRAGIWTETTNSAYSPVLARPNGYQNRIDFVQWWITSKLVHGNTYVLKRRDARGVVNQLFILDPMKVRPLIAPDGSVFYSLGADNLTQVDETLTVPAREMIHDRMNPLYHPLVGVSPIYACAMAAIQGLRIQQNSTRFFANSSTPGGVLTAPAQISDATAARLKAYWETNFVGDNVGKIAVLGDGLEYKPMAVSARDAQLIDQLKWTVETVCSVFHVPTYMIGGAVPPNYNNIEALNQQYYSQCLQILIEALELCLDEGLDLSASLTIEADIEDLLRMDTATAAETEKVLVGAGIKKPNESRRRLNLPPVEGGDAPYLQQQNYSLAALAKRDAAAPAPSTAPGGPPPPSPPADPGAAARTRAQLAAEWRQKALAAGLEAA